jgi:formylglycine-generating enzyme required for sulfatase activity
VEWEFAARAAGAAETRFSFGDDAGDLCRHGNGADLAARDVNPRWETAGCRDGFTHTAPVGTFEANGAGLHDLHGNVWEWVADCAPHLACTDSEARVLRGGSWSDAPRRLRSAARIAAPASARDQIAGFRVARSIAP